MRGSRRRLSQGVASHTCPARLLAFPQSRSRLSVRQLCLFLLGGASAWHTLQVALVGLLDLVAGAALELRVRTEKYENTPGACEH